MMAVESRRVPRGAERGHPSQLVRGRMLELDLLHVFMTVALCGGFTAASQVLNRTQAAVSMQIKRLEEIAGTQLIKRSSHGMELTAKGHILMGYARRMLAMHEEALGQIDSEAIAGRVRIGTFHQFAAHVLPPIIAAFSAIYPDVWVEVQVGLAKAMPQRIGAEFDLVIGLNQHDAGQGVVLMQDRVRWYTSLAHDVHLRDPLPLVLLPEGSLFRQWAIEALNRQGKRWTLAQVCSSTPLTEAALAVGMGVGLFKDGTVTSPHLRTLGGDEGFPDLPIVDITIENAAGSASPAARRLSEFIIKELARDAGFAEAE